ncbi:hypothetical protein LO763_23190 [Glycomyces sp. A-F 0318]|uniref:hypothetical protein n=1 Tax=Glycomyces amatae TaxID=2881355 RepID=UPI001E4F120E|nr:hypothetical protein [Glycomyces amatae]MCD0446526.1 hypothetical protein [Glycomyces amatae]
MARVTISGSDLVVTIEGIRRLGTLKSELTIPLANVRGATADPEISIDWPGLKAGGSWPGRRRVGTGLYGHYLGGVFTQDGDRVFWDVRDPAKAVVIELDGDDFSRLIVEVEDPGSTVESIRAAMPS